MTSIAPLPPCFLWGNSPHARHQIELSMLCCQRKIGSIDGTVVYVQGTKVAWSPVLPPLDPHFPGAKAGCRRPYVRVWCRRAACHTAQHVRSPPTERLDAAVTVTQRLPHADVLACPACSVNRIGRPVRVVDVLQRTVRLRL